MQFPIYKWTVLTTNKGLAAILLLRIGRKNLAESLKRNTSCDRGLTQSTKKLGLHLLSTDKAASSPVCLPAR